MQHSLVHHLERRAEATPHRVAITFTLDRGRADDARTYGRLAERARAVGGALERRGLRGSTALLLCDDGGAFLEAFFGCLYAGVVAVPVGVPAPPRPESGARRVAAIAAAAETAVVLSASRAIAEAVLPGATHLSADALAREGAPWSGRLPSPDDLAFLQYTSGSTRAPRGVEARHGNLLHNIAAMQEASGWTEETRTVSWLPLHHDMGLLSMLLAPIVLGAPVWNIPTADFLRDPCVWLRVLTRVGGVLSIAPPSGYAYCARRATDDDLAGLDLRAWTRAYVGAEPVSADVLEAFARRFAPCGFRPEHLVPAYGLAECMVYASSTPPLRGPVTARVSASSLAAGEAVPVDEAATARRLVASGATRAASGLELCVVDPVTLAALPDGRVGEVWVRGPSVARGYWREDAATAETFGACTADGASGYLRTGDLGFVRDGSLYVTGRRKDVIKVAGRSVYPSDVEAAVERAHRGVRAGCVAAFGVDTPSGEQVGVAVEVKRALPDAELAAVRAAVVRAVTAEADAPVCLVALLREDALPMTTSGKLQRAEARARALDGRFEAAGDLRALSDDVDPSRDVLARLRGRVAALLGRGAGEALPTDVPLAALGVDSLQRQEVRAALEAVAGREHHDVSIDGASTLEGIARAVTSAAPAPRVSQVVPAVARGSAAVLARRSADALARFDAMAARGELFYGRALTAQRGATVDCEDGAARQMHSTYSYLGLVEHPAIRAAAREAIDRWGTGTHGARANGGTLSLHRALEQRVARFTGREDAIVFSSGFAANVGALTALLRPGDTVVSDALCHASIVDGCMASRATVRVFRHGDLDDLDRVLSGLPDDALRLVVVDAVYSMDGDLLDLPRARAVCRAHGALLMVDEAHSLGVMGATGRGVEEHFGLPGAIDVAMGTFSKTIPANGGYIAGSRALVEYLRVTARPYIYSASMSPPVAAAALRAFDVLESDEGAALRARLWRNVRALVEGLRARGFDTGDACSPIVPVILGGDGPTLAMARRCQEAGLFVIPVLSPVVPEGRARLRLNVTALHTDADIARALEVLEGAARSLGVARAA